MRATLILGAALFVGALGAAPAFAQSGDWAATKCSDFVKLDSQAQANIAAQIGPAEVAKSLTSNSGSSSSTTAGTKTDQGQMASTGTAAPGTQNGPVKPGELVAACQAQPNLTLHDIVSQPGAANSGAGASSN